MKFIRLRCYMLALPLFISPGSIAQQKFIHTATRENIYCNSTCTLLDVPELNNNPGAIIFVTPITMNAYPLTAYYIETKKGVSQWSILNLDNAVIMPGAQFDVQYYTRPDSLHFVHVIAIKNLVNKGSYIDHTSLNDHPDAKFQFFQNCAPGIRGGIGNPNKIEVQYDTATGRWYMFNNNNRQLSYGNGYNIAVSSAGTSNFKTYSLNGATDSTGCGWIFSNNNLSNTNSGNVGIGTITPSQKLEVAGKIKAVSFSTVSDSRFKKNISPLKNALPKVLALNAVVYNWRSDEFKNAGFDNNLQIGFIAQEVEKIFPQLVHTGADGYKEMDYITLIPALIEAIKDQQRQIEKLDKIVERYLKH